MILIDGNCNAPEKLVLRATKPGTNIIMVQDHAIAVVNCLSIDATETATGVGGVVARQHTVIDYDTIIFGLLPGGTHVSLTEYSIASCLRSAWITGDAAYHARATYFSKLNLGCQINPPEQRAFSYFVDATAFSIIAAQGATFTGAATGVACNSVHSLIKFPSQPFPGSYPGNC